MEPWIEELIGKPYKKGGRNPEEGLDCYGLVRFVLNRALGLDLPDNVLMWRKYGIVLPDWVPIEPWDVLCFEGPGAPLGMIGHVGVAITPGDFIFSQPEYGGVVSNPISRWRSRLLYVARRK